MEYPTITEKEIDNLIHAYQSALIGKELISLDEPVGIDRPDREAVLADFVQSKTPSPCDYLLGKDLELQVDKLLSLLRPKEKIVIRIRFGLDPIPEGAPPTSFTRVKLDREATLRQVGWKLGLSRERVRQIEKDALEKMKNWAIRHGKDQ